MIGWEGFTVQLVRNYEYFIIFQNKIKKTKNKVNKI